MCIHICCSVVGANSAIIQQYLLIASASTIMAASSALPLTWEIGPISSPTLRWAQVIGGQPHRCRFCGLDLLTGESGTFCCNRGAKLASTPSLPPLPSQYYSFMLDPSVSANSRCLNLIFSFASLESTHPFPRDNGPQGFVSIQGKIYHRVRPSHHNSAVRWLLFDGFMQDLAGAPYNDADWADRIPSSWKVALRAALQLHNPFVLAIRSFGMMNPTQ